MRVNSANDACIMCENFVKFGPITPELTGLICERQVSCGQRTGVFRQISLDLLDGFCAIFSPYESALHADDGFVPYFPIC